MLESLKTISEVCKYLKLKFVKVDFISIYTKRHSFKVFENKIKDELNLESLKFLLTNTLTDGYNENNDLLIDYGEKGTLACYQMNIGLWLVISANKKEFPLINLDINKIERNNILYDLEVDEKITLDKREKKSTLKKASKKYFRAIEMEQNILPDLSIINKYFSSYLSYYKTADVLSSDFYWLKDTPASLFIALASCTNKNTEDEVSALKIHTLLNHRIEKNPLTSLELIHEDLLRINGVDSSDDSMSAKLVICRYDKKTGNVQIATSGISVLYIENENACNLITTKGNQSKDIANLKTENIKLNTNRGDKIIFYSDGLANQLDERGSKKLGNLGVKKIFVNMKGKFSGDKFEYALDNWKGNRKTIDDTTVLALQV